jgi:hypothetical protein
MLREQDGVGISRCSVIDVGTTTAINITVRIVSFANVAIQMPECAS